MNILNIKTTLIGSLATLALISSSVVFSHGDVTPQPVDTEGLEKLGEEWLEVNPYRGNGLAAEIGASAYNQNCARCHGLQAVSGGIAPDLRELPWGEDGDVFFVERVRNGAIRNGMTYMPSFEGIVSQEGLWAIRAYLDDLSVEKPDDFKLTEVEASSATKEKVEVAPVAVKAQEASADAKEDAGKERTGEAIVKKTCATCHALGVANAPKIDGSGKADWEKRHANGLDAMLESAKKGKGGMPPMGADPTLSDVELKSAIVHMLELAGVK
ncbi:MAG: Cytochrome C550 (Soluble cytochrome C) [uncultured Thiotrichaceae bacterium]|uniref:Cytochrome C550 (Soluble cytochrome C) n=1 Tax=uncultured Thiotrichaceae bacterium TaxID=298394 RepID=A0A6S6TSI7_9GAMM|nr:MAG: Cytochrome C550 (Soluble cytochrome C) [uncultured Thiotrichaceae bacterium]